MRYKNSLVHLGKGVPVSAVKTGGTLCFVIDVGGALIKKTAMAGGAVTGSKTVSYAERCVLLDGGIIEYAGGVRYEPRTA